MAPIDRLVDQFRRRVEKALPWFDEEEYARHTKDQEEVIADAEQTVKTARRSLEAYRRAHELRR